jgi:hypothetical protein
MSHRLSYSDRCSADKDKNTSEFRDNSANLVVTKVVTMASESNAAAPNSQPATQSPFEWLAGGLFFGRKGGIESIDSSKDVMSLLTGINDNLIEIVAERGINGPATQEPVEVKPEVESADPTPSKFLAARLSRLRFLLYDERRISSQQESREVHPR